MNAHDPMAPWRAAFDTVQAGERFGEGNRAAREAAFERFAKHGMPTKRDEYWKYTPVRGVAPDTAPGVAVGSDIFAGVDAFRIVFAGGRLDAERSDLDALSAEAELAGEAGADWLKDVYARLQARPVPGAMFQVERPFADLNMAMFSDGLALKVPAGKALSKPVHVRYEGAATAHLRLAIALEEGASMTLLESGAGALTTGAEITVADKAELHHLRSQTEVSGPLFTAIYGELGAEAQFKSFTLASDASLIRNETMLTLAGDNGSGHIAAGVMGRGSSLIDNTVYVSHEAEHGESRQVIKSVLDDAAQSVFQGKIYVRQGAQKTDGYQISQSVLLSEKAQFNAKPELEIYADDVACSHGSTTGALDETALFYLRSRGCTKREAEALLVAAFVDEAIEEIADEAMQDLMRTEVSRWMASRG